MGQPWGFSYISGGPSPRTSTEPGPRTETAPVIPNVGRNLGNLCNLAMPNEILLWYPFGHILWRTFGTRKRRFYVIHSVPDRDSHGHLLLATSTRGLQLLLGFFVGFRQVLLRELLSGSLDDQATLVGFPRLWDCVEMDVRDNLGIIRQRRIINIKEPATLSWWDLSAVLGACWGICCRDAAQRTRVNFSGPRGVVFFEFGCYRDFLRGDQETLEALIRCRGASPRGLPKIKCGCGEPYHDESVNTRNAHLGTISKKKRRVWEARDPVLPRR